LKVTTRGNPLRTDRPMYQPKDWNRRIY